MTERRLVEIDITDRGDGKGVAWDAATSIHKYVSLAGASGLVAVSVQHSTTQSIGNASETEVTFDTENYDPDGFHEGVTNPGRLTVPAGMGGLYFVTGRVTFVANSTGSRALELLVNGGIAAGLGRNQIAPVAATFGTGVEISGFVVLTAGQYVTMRAYQNISSGSLNIGHATDGRYRSMLAMVRLVSI